MGQTIADGAQLAADEANIETDNGTYRFRIKRYDSGLSARRAVANVRRAIADGAVAILDEGTGINASWRLARDADRLICITYQGGVDLVDPVERPNVFRIAPTDHGTAFRLAEYLVPKGLKIGLVGAEVGAVQNLAVNPASSVIYAGTRHLGLQQWRSACP